jgi:hypothetical protein
MATQNENARLAFRAIVDTRASKAMPKSNGGEYVLHTCTITEVPDAKLAALIGKPVTGTRTTKVVRDGAVVEKDGVEQGQEVTLYYSAVPKNDGSGMKHFWEIATQPIATSDEELDAFFAGAEVLSSQNSLA